MCKLVLKLAKYIFTFTNLALLQIRDTADYCYPMSPEIHNTASQRLVENLVARLRRRSVISNHPCCSFKREADRLLARERLLWKLFLYCVRSFPRLDFQA